MKLTPEYIASLAKTITEEELTDLIREYGVQEAETASYWSDKNDRD